MFMAHSHVWVRGQDNKTLWPGFLFNFGSEMNKRLIFFFTVTIWWIQKSPDQTIFVEEKR